MGRTARDHGESGIYHVVARGVGRQIIFEDDADRTRYLAELRRGLARDAGSAGDADATALLAWCLMDNHVHLVVDSEQGAPRGSCATWAPPTRSTSTSGTTGWATSSRDASAARP